MSFEFNNTNVEKEKKPEKLFRSFTVNPEELSIENLKKDLVPGNVNEKDPTKIGDGNELGVYMSTNNLMVEKNYSYDNNYEDLHIETPKHNDINFGSTVNYIKLPACGIVYEIDTAGLDIRKPQITTYLQGVYNNGAEGEEWIANTVPGKNCKIKKLILSDYANDRNRVEVALSGDNEEELEKAIDLIKEKFREKKEEALKLKAFLENLSEKERFSPPTVMKAKYEKYLKNLKETIK